MMPTSPVNCPSCSAVAATGAEICATCGAPLTEEVQSAEATALLADLVKALEGRYVIGEVLGSGRGGIVVRANHLASKRDVAIKVAWNDPNARTRVLRETVLTAKVGHPSALAVRDIPAPEPMLVVEMPLASGGTLGDLLADGRPVPYTRVLEIVRAIAAALDQGHAAGIIHGGLQPVKILLDGTGNPLVSDFSIRIPRRADWDVSRPIEVGAQAYMPLEQRHDSESIDGRVDQYALAIIAYELLRGRTTWRINAEGVLEVDAIDILVHRPIAPGAPLSASVAIKRATAKDPVFRYQSASSFVRGFAGETSEVVPKEQIHREEVAVQKSRSMMWILIPTVLAASLVAVQSGLRDEAIVWVKKSPLFGGSGNVSSTDPGSESALPQGTSAPLNPSSPEPDRREAGAPPANTRVGQETITPRAGRGGGPAIDPYPRVSPSNTTQPGASSDNSNTRRLGNTAPRTASPLAGSGTVGRDAGRGAVVGGEIAGGQAAARDSASQAAGGVMVVTLNANSRAVVVIDGRPRGQTPLTVQLSPGRHVVSLRGEERYLPSSRTVTISARDTVHTSFTLGGRP